MKPASLITLAALLAGCLSGCRTQQLASDQDHIRQAVLDLHTSQIVDNLVRTRKGLPIIQLDYTNMTGTVTQTGAMSGGGTQTVASTSFFNIPAAAAAVSRVVTGLGNLNTSATQVNQLTLTAQPVLTAPEVYNSYLNFMKVSDRLRETCDPPPPGTAVVVKCYDADCTDPACGGCDACGQRAWWQLRHKERPKVYYWVPVEHRDEFRRLGLYTVAVRGQPTAVTATFDVTVRGVVEQKEEKADSGIWTLKMKIDRRVPNDGGFLYATIKGKLYNDEQFTVFPNTTVPLAQPLDLSEEQKTDEIIVRFSLKTLGLKTVDEVVAGLGGQKVSVRLKQFVPSGSPTDRLLDDLKTQVELFRLGQQLQQGR